MSLLSQFLFRLAFGLALGLAVTPPRQVTGGYYRNHSYVLLGLAVLAALAAAADRQRLALAPPLVALAASYASCVLWWRGLAGAGMLSLLVVAASSVWGDWSAARWPDAAGSAAWFLAALDAPTAGLVLGFTIAAMFLGHWYLNTPSMALAPLLRLVALAAAAYVLRAIVCGAQLGLAVAVFGAPETRQWWLIGLRWMAGLAAPLALAGMTWHTLKIPNTQAATGMLYVAVILTFLGELVELLV